MIDSDTLWNHRQLRTAIHEAGHATIAIYEGLTFEEIIIQRGGDSNATMRNLRVPRVSEIEAVRIDLAGIMAARLARHQWGSFLFNTAHDDLGRVAEFFRRYSDSIAATASLKWNVRRTANTLIEHWVAVELIAAELINRKTIGYGTACELFYMAKEKNEHQPRGTLGKKAWDPLVDLLLLRIKFPVFDTVRL
jgi:hypothetical protein